MTNQYELIRDSLEADEKLSKLEEKATHGATEIRGPATEELRKEALKEYGTAYKAGTGQDFPDTIKPSDLKDEELKKAISDIHFRYKTEPANIFRAQPGETILNIPKTNLEALASKQTIIALSERDDQEILLRYGGIQEAKDLLRRYKNGEPLSKEEAKILEESVNKGQALYIDEIKGRRRAQIDLVGILWNKNN